MGYIFKNPGGSFAKSAAEGVSFDIDRWIVIERSRTDRGGREGSGPPELREPAAAPLPDLARVVRSGDLGQ